VLRGRVAEINGSSEELQKVGREAIDFHGEMVLLENYSALNCFRLVKILKKYDKLSGALIRLPFIQKFLQEPFFKTDVLNQLVKDLRSQLRVLKEIRSGSSTISAFSLPPMHSNELQEVWKKAPAVEQEAKYNQRSS
ncbi:hypothetical protein RJ639_001915, partial [Escallonia herrerae]